MIKFTPVKTNNSLNLTYRSNDSPRFKFGATRNTRVVSARGTRPRFSKSKKGDFRLERVKSESSLSTPEIGIQHAPSCKMHSSPKTHPHAFP